MQVDGKQASLKSTPLKKTEGTGKAICYVELHTTQLLS